MQSTRQTHRATSGFTLIEMLVIAPIAILLIATFIGVMVAMVGSTLVSQEKTRIATDTEQALAQIEQDVRNSVQFTTTSTVTSPQGASDNTAAWTTKTGSGGPLVLKQYATTSNPQNTSNGNSLIYINNSPNACTSADRTYNAPYSLYVVYFVKNNSLWRRTILPNVIDGSGTNNGQPNANASSGNICDSTNSGTAPWQKNSCTTGSGGNCAVKDDKLADNVSSLTLTFYAAASDTTSTTAYAISTSVSAALKLQNTTAGQTFNYTGTLRVRRLN